MFDTQPPQHAGLEPIRSSGVFASPALEAEYRAQRLPADRRQAVWVIAIGLLGALYFGISDWRLFGPSPHFWVLMGARGIFALASLAIIALLCRTGSVRDFDRLLLLWVAGLAVVDICITSTRPGDTFGHAVLHASLPLMFYLILPLSLAAQTAGALLISIAYLGLLAWVIQPVDPIIQTTTIGGIVASNILGYVTSWRLQHGRRRQFAVLRQLAKTGEALRDSLEKYRVLFETFPLGITVSDSAGHIVENNAIAEELLGAPRFELEQRTIDGQEWHLIRPDGTPMPPDEYASVRALRENRPVHNVRMGVVKAGGATTWLSITAAPIPLDNHGVVVTYGDITERKRMEDALRENETRFRLLFANNPLPMWLYDPVTLRYLEVNDAAVASCGYSREEFLAMRVTDIRPPEDAPRLLEYLAQRPAGRMKTGLWRHRRKDGSLIDVDILNHGFELDGRAVMLTAAVDVTEQLRAQREIQELNDRLEQRVAERTADLEIEIAERQWVEEQLRQSEELARRQLAEIQAYYDTAPVGLFVLDLDLRYLRINQRLAEINGQSVAAHLGRTVRDLVPDLADTLEPLYHRVLNTGEPLLNLEITGETAARSGVGRIWQAHYYPLRSAAGDIIGINGMVEDITERKQAEAELRHSRDQLQAANLELARASRLKDEFLASMSHELRTPLTAILGLTEALREQVYGPLPDKPLDMLKMIEDSGRHLLALINDILDLAKIQAGQVELMLAPCLLAEVGQASLHLIKGMAAKKRHRVEFAVAPPDLMVEADGRRLKQMLVNLLGNAVKFTPAGGRIGLDITGDPDARVVRLAVWDTGIGIAAEDMPRLFDNFVQLDARLSRQYEGTGLGLALVKRMAELHGGEVTVESTPGQGSRFTLILPWRPAAVPAA